MVCSASAKTRRGPFSSSQLCGTRSAGPKPSSASDGYHQKTSSSVIRMSAWPSPVRSTNLRLELFHSTLGTDLNDLNDSQSSSCVRSKKPGVCPPNATRSSCPSPARSRNCCPPPLSAAKEGVFATSSRGAKRALTSSLSLVLIGKGLKLRL